MGEFICIKEIPNLCGVNERGTIVSETFTTFIDLIDELHPKGFGFFRKINKTILKFNFKNMFYENHVNLAIGEPIQLKEYFRKI